MVISAAARAAAKILAKAKRDAYNKAYNKAYYLKKSESIKAAHKKNYRLKNPEKSPEQIRKRQEASRAKTRERQRIFREKNPDYQKKYRKKNPEINIIYRKVHRDEINRKQREVAAAKRAAIGVVTGVRTRGIGREFLIGPSTNWKSKVKKLKKKPAITVTADYPKKKRKHTESADEYAQRIWDEMYSKQKVTGFGFAGIFGGLAAYANWNRGEDRS